jgi:serine/threonine protein kinase
MDFGLAKVRGGDELTKEHSTLGTAAYMSPEQALDKKDIDHRTDIWSFGVVLYEMLTGQFPFQGEYDSAVLYSIMNEAPETIATMRSDIPTALEQIVYKCLEKKAADRYLSAEHLLTDLKQLEKKLESGGRTAQVVQPPAETRKHIPKSVIFAAALVLVVAALAIGYSLFQQKISTPKIVQIHALTSTMDVDEGGPLLSPDGTKMAYNSDEDGEHDLWVRQLVSGQTMNLTKNEKSPIGSYSWSPDGQRIALISGTSWSSARQQGSGQRLWSIRADGSDAIAVTDSIIEPQFPFWAHDGKRIFFKWNRGGVRDIWWMLILTPFRTMAPGWPFPPGGTTPIFGPSLLKQIAVLRWMTLFRSPMKTT